MAKSGYNNDKQQVRSATSTSAKTWTKGTFKVSNEKKVPSQPLHLMYFYTCSVTGAIILRLLNPSKGTNQESFTLNLRTLYRENETLKKYFIGEFIAGKGYDKLLNDTKTYNQHGFVFKTDETKNIRTFIKSVLVPAIKEVNK